MTKWKIAVEAPIERLLTYSTDLELTPGESVVVPLGKREAFGVVIEPANEEPASKFELKGILGLHPERPRLPFSLVSWALWIARYYHHPPGEVFALFFPPLKKTGRSAPKDLFDVQARETDLKLNHEQQVTADAISAGKGFAAHLLWGVTGSGKTEVYIDVIQRKLAEGKGAIVLVPEIALTPQLISRFRNRLGDTVAMLHSDLTDREKTNQWWAVAEKQKRVLIGARSALFCPMPDLGVIIVDEEHEASYKQDESLRYHARDTAVMRAHYEKVPIVLGSATPSLESWKNVQDKKYSLHLLRERAATLTMPEIIVVDLAEKTADGERPNAALPFWLSVPLYEALQSNYKNGLQSALFLNRRGIAQTVLCADCGFIYKCPNCEISLTLHGRSHLVCHYCQYAAEMASDCPDCKMGKIKPVGLGTELLEEDLKKIFPLARVARVDRDEIDSRQRMEDFVKRMENHDIDILVGTQMIAKGLDFEKLTLVGIVMADIAFNIPDFRAGERSFQLLTQVSGRSGRHQQGRVIIQTYRPDHPSVMFSQLHDTQNFMQTELDSRQELNYPPYARLACLKISGLHQNQVEQMANDLAASLRQYIEVKALKNLRLLGPAPAPLLKIRNRYRYQILLKAESNADLHELLQYAGHLEAQLKKVKLQVDVDPYNLM